MQKQWEVTEANKLKVGSVESRTISVLIEIPKLIEMR